MPILNYDASVPINTRAPFSVNVDAATPPGDRTYRDYVPRNQKSPTKPDDSVRRKNFATPPVARYQEDYISREDANAKQLSEREQIVEIAKEIYASERKKREAYESAKKLLDEKKQAEITAEDWAKAVKLVEGVKPITKEEAMTRAAKQFYMQRK